MTTNQRTMESPSLESASSTTRERARDEIHLMFLMDDFRRATTRHNLLVGSATTLVSFKAGEHMPPDAALKVAAEMLMVIEMARNVTACGEAMIKQAEKVIGKIPPWDRR
jgi:hypothetical protein